MSDDIDQQLKVSTSSKKKKKAKPTLVVPIDEACTLSQSHRVHIDANDGEIFDVTLNQTNAGNNNNKFYRIQLLVDDDGDYRTYTRWGRVGERGQQKLLGGGDLGDALRNFNQKFKEKTGLHWSDRLEAAVPGKYTFIERSYEDSSTEEEDSLPGAGKRRASKEDVEETIEAQSQLSGPVQRLMELIFNQQNFEQALAALDYDADKMPLGKLSKRTLMAGYAILKELAAIIDNPSPGSHDSVGGLVETLSNRYFSTIPHSFGRMRPPLLQGMALIKKEIDLLENLTDMQLANEIMKKSAKQSHHAAQVDQQYHGLGMEEMIPLDSDSAEFRNLQDYLKKSAGQTHGIGYKIQDIFRIERAGEKKRFAQYYSNLSNSDRRLLWHGSRCTNFGGILSQGLRIAPPEAPVSGYMFGKGVYLADISTKSANYCAAYSSNNIGLLLLCEAELGKPPLELLDADYNAGTRASEMGSISTLGQGVIVPADWKDAACVHESLKGVSMPDMTNPPVNGGMGTHLQYNEYIVYDIAQIRLRYLFRVQIA